jgi:hypothetical protein
MNHCPDQECRDNVTRVSLFMKIFGASVTLIVSAVLGISLYGMTAEKDQNKKISENERKGERFSVKQDVVILNQTLFRQDIKNLQESREKDKEELRKVLEKNQKEILEAIRKNP